MAKGTKSKTKNFTVVKYRCLFVDRLKTIKNIIRCSHPFILCINFQICHNPNFNLGFKLSDYLQRLQPFWLIHQFFLQGSQTLLIKVFIKDFCNQEVELKSPRLSYPKNCRSFSGQQIAKVSPRKPDHGSIEPTASVVILSN